MNDGPASSPDLAALDCRAMDAPHAMDAMQVEAHLTHAVASLSIRDFICTAKVDALNP